MNDYIDDTRINDCPDDTGYIPKKRHPVLRVLFILIFGVILGICLFLLSNIIGNSKQAEHAAEAAIQTVGSKYRLTPIDCSKYDGAKLGNMKIKVEQFDVEGLGRLMVMEGEGTLAQTVNVVLTPIKKDMPLLTMQFAYVLGSRVIAVDVYDLTAEPGAADEAIAALAEIGSEYKDLEDAHDDYDISRVAGIGKKASKGFDDSIPYLIIRYLMMYCNVSDDMPQLDDSAVNAKIGAISGYVDRLLDGDEVADTMTGKDKEELSIREFAENVMFGIGEYK